MPRFSVVVPAYNASATLGETLDAMLQQEFADWECIVVDDGSADDTAMIASGYVERDSRFRLIRQENQGTAGAYRTGLESSGADLLVICAADDLLLPRHLLVMDDLVTRHPNCGIYSCNGEFLDHETGNRRVGYVGPEWQREKSLTFEQVIVGCFYSVGVVFTRGTYDLVGGHRVGVYVDDYDLWLRAMARGVKHCYSPEVLSVHRVSSFQQSASGRRVLESNIEVYEHLLSQGPLSDPQVALVHESIERNRAQIEYLIGTELERQAQAFRARVEGCVGPNHIDAVMWVIHRFSWVLAPIRRLLVRRNLRYNIVGAPPSSGD